MMEGCMWLELAERKVEKCLLFAPNATKIRTVRSEKRLNGW